MLDNLGFQVKIPETVFITQSLKTLIANILKKLITGTAYPSFYTCDIFVQFVQDMNCVGLSAGFIQRKLYLHNKKGTDTLLDIMKKKKCG